MGKKHSIYREFSTILGQASTGDNRMYPLQIERITVSPDIMKQEANDAFPKCISNCPSPKHLNKPLLLGNLDSLIRMGILSLTFKVGLKLIFSNDLQNVVDVYAV